MRRAWQPTPAFLPRESLGLRSLVGYSPVGLPQQTQTQRNKLAHIHAYLSTEGLFQVLAPENTEK